MVLQTYFASSELKTHVSKQLHTRIKNPLLFRSLMNVVSSLICFVESEGGGVW